VAAPAEITLPESLPGDRFDFETTTTVHPSLDGRLLLDHRNSRFRFGRVGLWTKADSITAFDDLTIRGVR